VGRFESAQRGTIFLDEIGELPPETQVLLLRVLQEREFERVGGGELIRADVRVIAATHCDLEVAISEGSFRSDLFYRLNVFPIEISPLRERKEDLPVLIAFCVTHFASKNGKTITRIDKKSMEMLRSYHWPGNVRELQNVIERSVITCEGDTLFVEETWIASGVAPKKSPTQRFGDALSAHERELIESALSKSRGRISGPTGAAAKLDMPPSTLDAKILSLGIDKHRFKSPRRGAS
jgi:formate hydrogenlyase transcriptional activator